MWAVLEFCVRHWRQWLKLEIIINMKVSCQVHWLSHMCVNSSTCVFLHSLFKTNLQRPLLWSLYTMTCACSLCDVISKHSSCSSHWCRWCGDFFFASCISIEAQMVSIVCYRLHLLSLLRAPKHRNWFDPCFDTVFWANIYITIIYRNNPNRVKTGKTETRHLSPRCF